jgi:hypothetical protein
MMGCKLNPPGITRSLYLRSFSLSLAPALLPLWTFPAARVVGIWGVLFLLPPKVPTIDASMS